MAQLETKRLKGDGPFKGVGELVKRIKGKKGFANATFKLRHLQVNEIYCKKQFVYLCNSPPHWGANAYYWGSRISWFKSRLRGERGKIYWAPNFCLDSSGNYDTIIIKYAAIYIYIYCLSLRSLSLSFLAFTLREAHRNREMQQQKRIITIPKKRRLPLMPIHL